MITVVKIDDECATAVQIDEKNTLGAMYTIIDCHSVDVVRLAPGIDMWIDDEGMMTSDINPLATAVARTYGWTHQPYFGTALITGNKGPNTTGLTDAQVTDILMRAMGGVPL